MWLKTNTGGTYNLTSFQWIATEKISEKMRESKNGDKIPDGFDFCIAAYTSNEFGAFGVLISYAADKEAAEEQLKEIERSIESGYKFYSLV